MDKSRIRQAFELIREEAVDRMKPGSDYVGLLCAVRLEVDTLLIAEMAEFRLAERWKKKKDGKK
ncbi:MAG TPA: hypothetical protein VMW44_01285 [Candidatus Bathyarchaeia archaeon]|nr:hypothetical protein [Candidatus Bathyarchaeia archaeon]